MPNVSGSNALAMIIVKTRAPALPIREAITFQRELANIVPLRLEAFFTITIESLVLFKMYCSESNIKFLKIYEIFNSFILLILW